MFEIKCKHCGTPDLIICVPEHLSLLFITLSIAVMAAILVPLRIDDWLHYKGNLFLLLRHEWLVMVRTIAAYFAALIVIGYFSLFFRKCWKCGKRLRSLPLSGRLSRRNN